MCVPSLKREGFASVPEATWEDVGALEDIKKELRSAILVRFSYFNNFLFHKTNALVKFGS